MGLRSRWLLSRAKHPSLAGHPRIGKLLAKLVPLYEYAGDAFFASDGAPAGVATRRRKGFERLARQLNGRSPETVRATERLSPHVSDLQFTSRYRVPFQYSRFVRDHLKIGAFVESSDGVQLQDLDGNTAYDLAGSYGVNVFGNDFYKDCIDAGIAKVRPLGPVLGAYHPLIEDNVRALRQISGLDEVSFHMSGTEAVMQAVRLARYHTGRSHLVRFAGAYHGWWDDVQPGVGTPGKVAGVYTLREMDPRTLEVLRTRRDIACVLVNPLQALHPNCSAPADSTLLASDRAAGVDRAGYTAWLTALREVCSRRSIVLVFDEIFVGFRIAYGGAQEYFGVRADMVTYGKTLGGGLPIGVLCGRSALMKRFRDERPSDICFARGTFNSHPYVMAAMHEFLERTNTASGRACYERADRVWTERCASLNARLGAERLPVRVSNLCSIWTVWYVQPSRYNWMFQFYLRSQGLALSWVGTGRLVFSHAYTDDDVAAVFERFVAAAREMQEDGWWWRQPALTNRSIKRQVLREVVRALLQHRSAAPAHASGVTIGSNSSPRST